MGATERRRRRGRGETPRSGPDKGWGRVGPAGAGHYAKMVHNGIECGIMQAYAEGLDLLRHEFGGHAVKTAGKD